MDATEFMGQGQSLNAKIVQDSGIEMKPLTVEEVEVREYDDGDKKLAVSFDEIDQALILNKTNTATMVDAFGKETTGWTKKQILLVVVKTNFEGKLGIQVKPIKV